MIFKILSEFMEKVNRFAKVLEIPELEWQLKPKAI
jgi:hypothetical protein